MKRLLSTLLILLNVYFVAAQTLPINQKTKEVLYTDVIVFDTLTTDTAFTQMLLYLNSDTIHNTNIQVDSNLLLITYTSTRICYAPFPNVFGKIQYDVRLRFFSNKFGYRMTNFKHVPLNGIPSCTNNLNQKKRPQCFIGEYSEKYWEEIIKETIANMNDSILMLCIVTMRNQPTIQILHMNEYFLGKNRQYGTY